MKKRVLITGVGLISCLGESPAFFHKQLCEGRNSLGQIGEYVQQGFEPQPGGKVLSFDPEVHLKGKPLRPLDRTGRLFASAAKLALESSGWTSQARAGHDIGLVLGTMFGSMHTISQFDRQSLIGGPSSASPLDFANTVINSAAGQTAIWHKLRGINSTTSTGATSGLMAIGYAADLIRYGRQTAVLVGGADEFCFEAFCGFAKAGLLCGAASKQGYPIPFDERRTGLALTEAATGLMLEDSESAQARGATVLGEIRGHANAYNPKWSKLGYRSDAIIRAIRGAIDEARLSPVDINCVSASANGSVIGDRGEAAAIKAVFKGQNDRVPITAIKSMIGETLGAAGALQVIDLLEAMRDRMLPPIANLEHIDPALPHLHFCRTPQVIDGLVGLINAVGFDGHACSLIVSRPSEHDCI